MSVSQGWYGTTAVRAVYPTRDRVAQVLADDPVKGLGRPRPYRVPAHCPGHGSRTATTTRCSRDGKYPVRAIMPSSVHCQPCNTAPVLAMTTFTKLEQGEHWPLGSRSRSRRRDAKSTRCCPVRPQHPLRAPATGHAAVRTMPTAIRPPAPGRAGYAHHTRSSSHIEPGRAERRAVHRRPADRRAHHNRPARYNAHARAASGPIAETDAATQNHASPARQVSTISHSIAGDRRDPASQAGCPALPCLRHKSPQHQRGQDRARNWPRVGRDPLPTGSSPARESQRSSRVQVAHTETVPQNKMMAPTISAGPPPRRRKPRATTRALTMPQPTATRNREKGAQTVENTAAIRTVVTENRTPGKRVLLPDRRKATAARRAASAARAPIQGQAHLAGWSSRNLLSGFPAHPAYEGRQGSGRAKRIQPITHTHHRDSNLHSSIGEIQSRATRPALLARLRTSRHNTEK